jgi:hypothetical protein
VFGDNLQLDNPLGIESLLPHLLVSPPDLFKGFKMQTRFYYLLLLSISSRCLIRCGFGPGSLRNFFDPWLDHSSLISDATESLKRTREPVVR